MSPTTIIPDDVVDLERDERPFRFHPDEGGFCHYGPVLYAPPSKAANAASVTAHELCHYWMHSATPYGFVLDELADLEVGASSLYCASLHNSGQQIPIPAVDIAMAFREGRLESAGFRLLHELSIQHVIPWTHDLLLERWLEGVDHRSVRAAKLPKLLRWLTDFEARSVAEHPDAERFSRTPPARSDYQREFVLYWADYLDTHEEPSFPTVGLTDGGSVPLGARQIFEACALHVEKMDMPFWDSASTTLQDEYWNLFAAFLGKYPEEITSQEHMVSVVSTFMAVGDLALSTPIGGVYGRLREDTMTWHDLHPGWRFVQLMDKLQPEDWVQDVEDAPRLQSRLSVNLGWPSPDRFRLLGTQLAPSTRTAARHVLACQMRLDADDRLIVTPSIDWGRLESFLVAYPPIYIRGSDSRVPGATTREKLRPLTEYVLARFTWMTMREGRVHWPDLFPTNLDFTNIFANVNSRDELVAIMRGVPPLYPDDAFCSAEDFLSQNAQLDDGPAAG